MAPEARWRVLWTCVLSTFAAYLCLLFLNPIYPDVARDLHLRADTLSLLLAIAPGLAVAMNLPVGIMADRLGRRPLLVAGGALLIVSQLLVWAAINPFLFAVSRVSLGFAIPFVASAAYAAVADAHPAGDRIQALGMVTASVNLGQAGGYVATAVLAERLGWHLLALTLAVVPLSMLLFALRMPEPPAATVQASLGAAVGNALRFLARPANTASALVATAVNGAGVSATFLLPFAARSEGLGTTTTALLLIVYLAAAAIAAPIVGRLADRGRPRALLGVCLGVAAASLAIFAFAGPAVAVVLPVYAVVGGTVAAAASLNTSLVVQAARKSGTGTGAALGGLRLGQVLGPALVMPAAAALYTHVSLRSAVLMLACLALAALVLTLAGRRRPDPDTEVTGRPTTKSA
jgi:predicted MFS family arabinose efflux permease